jgi:hypothetical protein
LIDEDNAPGWDAIHLAVTRIVGQQEPLHWGTGTLPGQDGVYGISAYRAGGHWLLVTFGLTDLFDTTEDEDTDVSGWGYELTLRVPAAGDPPAWSLRLLEQLGRYVYSGAKSIRARHRLDPGGPITGKPDTRLTALVFTEDPQLSQISSPNGSVSFIAVVGITAAELAQMKTSSTEAVVADLRNRSTLLVTDVGR